MVCAWMSVTWTMLPPTSALVRQRGLSLLALADEQRPWAWPAHAALTGQDTPPRPSGAGSHRRDDRHKAVPLPMVRCARGRHAGTTPGSLTPELTRDVRLHAVIDETWT